MFNRIVCGNCLEELPALPPECARLVIADPPYFNVLLGEEWDTRWPNEAAYLEWTTRWIEAAMRTLLPGGLLYIFGQLGKREHVWLHVMSRAAEMWQFHDLIIWDRAVGYNERRDSFTPAYEMMLVLRKPGEVFFDKTAVREPYDAATIARYEKDKRYKNPESRRSHLEAGKYATNIWRIPSLKGASKEKSGHPPQKPVALIERIIASSSQPGDLVIDPFFGSGTAGLVAQKFERRWLGVELRADYVQMARKRIQRECPDWREGEG